MEGGTILSSALTQAMTTGVGNAVQAAQEGIGAVLPQALILMGVILGISVGIRIFRRFAN